MLLYIHIPFCDSRCFYCAFNTYSDKFYLKQKYMKALKIQLEYEIKSNLKNHEKFETIFIGGGTPSTIDIKEYKQIFELLKNHIDKNTEITTECNPNSATIKWLEGMKNFGVNRISFGVQSFDDEKLKKLNRAHNSKGAIKAIQSASCVGFNRINCDIIYGVEGDSLNSLIKDLEIAFCLPITHLSAYSLTLEEGTKFYNKSSIKIDDEELSYKLFDYIEKRGFKQYEISNFAKSKDEESKHNYGYWQYKNYLGVGAGAVGFIDKQRYYTNKSIEEYIKNPTTYKIEKISAYDKKVEKVLLGFRCSLGVEEKLFTSKELAKIKYLLEEKKLIKKKDKIINKNFLLADELALYILE